MSDQDNGLSPEQEQALEEQQAAQEDEEMEIYYDYYINCAVSVLSAIDGLDPALPENEDIPGMRKRCLWLLDQSVRKLVKDFKEVHTRK